MKYSETWTLALLLANTFFLVVFGVLLLIHLVEGK